MGETVEFPSNGSSASGYLAPSATGSSPGVLVIQEWWGLVPQIKGVADRLAAEGFTALAPDLYHGEIAEHTEMDKAGRLMSSLPPDRAARDMGGAIDFLLGHAATSTEKVGVVGFCMGGALALLLATKRPDAVKAVVPFYGVIGWPAEQPDWNNLAAAVQGHYAENDEFASPDKVAALEAQLNELGKDVEIFTYPGTEHAFFNDTRPEVYDADAAKQAWERTTAFFRQRLG